ncbi:hypothetical protein PR048_010148 [Dryococelus australis]|uniref:Uncharacterized protein n=1 Tax=Dryococelus australis TaxID=614101 RepID=A0ABQ9I1X0_9NEOP|nr:hypothetical protein PR048_010148 [Dryococelus australis]
MLQQWECCSPGRAKFHDRGLPTKNIVKRRKHLTSLKPTNIAKGIQIGEPKFEYFPKLLRTHFGDQWESMKRLRYYKTVLLANKEVTVVEDNDTDFDVLPDDDAIKI